jgi:hypothetical protein
VRARAWRWGGCLLGSSLREQRHGLALATHELDLAHDGLEIGTRELHAVFAREDGHRRAHARGVDPLAVERELHVVGCVGDGEDHVGDARLEQRELSGGGVACGVVLRVGLGFRRGVAHRGEHAVVGLGRTAELAQAACDVELRVGAAGLGGERLEERQRAAKSPASNDACASPKALRCAGVGAVSARAGAMGTAAS